MAISNDASNIPECVKGCPCFYIGGHHSAVCPGTVQLAVFFICAVRRIHCNWQFFSYVPFVVSRLLQTPTQKMAPYGTKAFYPELTARPAQDGRSVVYSMRADESKSGAVLLSAMAATEAAATQERSLTVILVVGSTPTRKNGAGAEISKLWQGGNLLAQSFTKLGEDITVTVCDFCSGEKGDVYVDGNQVKMPPQHAVDNLETTARSFGVCLSKPGQPKPYQARVSRGGKYAHLGCFVTAEEAALCVARSPEGQAAVEKVAAAPPLTSKEALQQARDTIIGAVALDIIYEAAGAATAELSAEVAAEVMAGIAMGL